MLSKLEKKVLDNGFEIYFLPLNAGSNVVSVNLFYKVGSNDETRGISGISHMLEHMNFKSTKNHKAGEFDNIIKSIGGVTNASTGFDTTHYFVNCAASDFAVPVRLFADMMQNLLFLESEFLPERDVVLEERRLRVDNSPFGEAYWTLFNTAFERKDWLPIGHEEDVKALDTQKLKDFWANFYQPQNAFLLVAGDVSGEAVFGVASEAFGAVKNSGSVKRVRETEPKRHGERESVLERKSQSELVYLGFRLPSFEHEDIHALKAVAEVFDSGKNSPFERILVDEKQVATSVFADVLDNKGDSMFVVAGVCEEGVSAGELKDEILNVVRGFDVSDEELEMLNNTMKFERAFLKMSSAGLCDAVGRYISLGDLTPLKRMFSDTPLSKEAMKKVVERYLVSENLTSVILKRAA